MEDQTSCAGLATKSAVIPLAFLMVVVAQSAATAGQVTATDVGNGLPERNWVLAQAGSVGGSVANQGKSVSGGQDTDLPHKPKSESSRPREHKQPQTLAIYDGTWAGASTGACISEYRWTVQVSNGTMSGNRVDGHISRGGSAVGVMTVGTTYDFKGHVSSSQAAGTWTRPDGCSGKWTATKS